MGKKTQSQLIDKSLVILMKYDLIILREGNDAKDEKFPRLRFIKK